MGFLRKGKLLPDTALDGFRNPARITTWDVENLVNNKLPTSTGFLAGFLNHQQYGGWVVGWIFHGRKIEFLEG